MALNGGPLGGLRKSIEQSIEERISSMPRPFTMPSALSEMHDAGRAAGEKAMQEWLATAKANFGAVGAGGSALKFAFGPPGEAVPVDPGFSQLTPRLLSALETKA